MPSRAPVGTEGVPDARLQRAIEELEATQRRLDERLERTRATFETLAKLGHSVNNPLTALLGRAQILKLKKGDDPAVAKPVNVIAETATRITDLVREMSKVLKAGREELLQELRERGAADEESEAKERAS
jgi:signal transduction histidine kinase